jgi:hypothetical protein
MARLFHMSSDVKRMMKCRHIPKTIVPGYRPEKKYCTQFTDFSLQRVLDSIQVHSYTNRYGCTKRYETAVICHSKQVSGVIRGIRIVEVQHINIQKTIQ